MNEPCVVTYLHPCKGVLIIHDIPGGTSGISQVPLPASCPEAVKHVAALIEGLEGTRDRLMASWEAEIDERYEDVAGRETVPTVSVAATGASRDGR